MAKVSSQISGGTFLEIGGCFHPRQVVGSYYLSFKQKEMLLYHISAWAYGTMSAIFFICALLYCFRKGQPLFIRTIAYYAIINVISEVAGLLVPLLYVYIPFTIIEWGLFLLVFWQIDDKGKFGRWGFIGGIGLLLVAIACGIGKHWDEFEEILILFESFSLTLCSLSFFWSVFYKSVKTPLYNWASFWVATGVLSYFGLLIVILLLSSLFFINKNKEATGAAYSFNNFLQIVSNLMFIKAMTCKSPVRS